MKKMNLVLNLDESFKPFGESDVRIDLINFPSGCEPHIKVLNSDKLDGCKVLLTCRIRNMNDLMRVLFVKDALDRCDVLSVGLFIPYLPFARQDRVMVSGEPFSLKVFANILNSCDFNIIKSFDVHSDVGCALLNKFVGLDNHGFVYNVLSSKKDFIIISPDAGAYKKIFKLCQFLNYSGDIVMCNKVREVSTGHIQSVTVSETDFKGKDLYIVDDICDGGGTFVMLAKELKKRNAGKINLIVSHGIFSKGIDAIEDVDHIYTTDSFKEIIHPKLTQIKLCDTLS